MPTKHRRHAITETPEVKEALEALRADLHEDRIDLAELVIMGAEAKLARARSEDERRRALREDLVRRLRSRDLDVDPVLADEAKRAGLPDVGPLDSD